MVIITQAHLFRNYSAKNRTLRALFTKNEGFHSYIITQLLLVLKFSENEVAQVAAVIMAGAGVIAYIVGEGMADAAGAKADMYIMKPEQEPPND